MTRLTSMLGGPRLWIKRDDCTGLSTGGNKARKLEFLMGEALAVGADAIITQGATQSNHARQTAAAAARFGMECHLLLEDRTGYESADYRLNGNVLLDRLHGATVSMRPAGADMNAEMELLASKLRAAHKHPYVITGGGSDPVGALGYVNAAWELARQAEALNLDLSHLVVATGSGGTQAGLVAGLAAAALPVCVLGIGVRAPRERQEAVVFDLASRTAALIGCEGVVRRDQVVANCDYIGEGYGVPSVGTREAIKLLARTEGLLLDPVYSGKAMDGLIDLIGKGFFPKDRDVVFLHTGGSSALFGYPDAFELAGYA